MNKKLRELLLKNMSLLEEFRTFIEEVQTKYAIGEGVQECEDMKALCTAIITEDVNALNFPAVHIPNTVEECNATIAVYKISRYSHTKQGMAPELNGEYAHVTDLFGALRAALNAEGDAL